jgi:RNA polymerase sigma-70 factor, ECF subfamily
MVEMNTTVQSETGFEQQWVSRARAGDLDAFNQIVDWYQGLVYRVCLRILGNTAKAEDATQDTFIKAYTSLDQYHGGSFKSWLTRIATNRCYDIIRSERRRPASSLDAQPVESEPSWSVEPESESPDSYAARSQLGEYLERALGQLPGDQRIAIVLYDINGYSYEEIAEIVDGSLGTVKSRISRGRARLREILRADDESRELFDAVWRHFDDEPTSRTRQQ